jgi:Family of unknown function (DUF6941)
MPDKYKVRSVIFCDDVRQEVTGKEILIGVYNYIILYPQFPAFVPRLIVKIYFNVKDKTAKQFVLHLKDKDGVVLSTINGELPAAANWDEPFSLGFALGPLTFYSQGHFFLEFGPANEQPEVISDVEIRLPVDDTERARVPIS